MNQVKYLIVGQGLAGSLLAWEFEKAGIAYAVYDEVIENASSNKAAGIFNPITGRKMVKTWMADEIFPKLGPYYQELETVVNHQLIYHKPIYRPFTSIDEQNDWQGKVAEEGYARYIQNLYNSPLGVKGLKDPFGGILIGYSGYVDVPQLVKQVRNFLIGKKKFIHEVFASNQIILKKGKVEYRGMVADKVIFCDGVSSTNNRFWNYLPFKPVKGEILEIEANFSEDLIVNRHVFLVPKKGSFIVGSTYNHEQLDDKPSAQGIRNIQDRLERILAIDYRIKSSWAGVRPATYDRHPFIGLHPKFPELGIFNGFGTKGVSLVPFFASEFVNFLKGNQPLAPEVDIKRVSSS